MFPKANKSLEDIPVLLILEQAQTNTPLQITADD